MPYSMVGAPALGYDLARLPQGEHVAIVVRTALRCTPRHLRRLSSHHPGLSRRRSLWEAMPVAAPETMTSAVALGVESLDLALRGQGDASAEVLHRLERASLGNTGALDRFLRRDVLDWTWSQRSEHLQVQEPHAARAADVLVDAAASAFSTDLPADERRSMATPFLVTGLALVDDSTGTGHDEVDRLLEIVARCDSATRDEWRTATDQLRPHTVEWAPAMHQATWALHLSDRLRLAVDAQMAAVTAFRAAGFTSRDAAYGVWNALSGAVQATAVADLLPDHDRVVLMRAWDRVHGAV